LQDSTKDEKAIAVHIARARQSLAHWLGAIKRKAFGRSIVGKGVKNYKPNRPFLAIIFELSNL
jgi:hypothetical protein